MTTDSCSTRRVIVGDAINLDIRVLNALGQATDADSTPWVEVKDDGGNVIRALSPSGVVRVDTGVYRLTYTVPAGSNTGVWTDSWRAVVDGFTTDNSLEFIVLSASSTIAAGGSSVGDPPCVEYTQEEINGINILLELLRYRLRDIDIYSETKDEYGQDTLTECNIYSDSYLLSYLRGALFQFNGTAHFTSYLFSDTVIQTMFAHIIVEGAFIMALSAQMLVEKGRSFVINDNGVSLTPSDLADLMNSHVGMLITSHREQLRFIKANIKPTPIGMGTYRVLSASPAFLRLRHLRSRQII
jgi:hypothetical protein